MSRPKKNLFFFCLLLLSASCVRPESITDDYTNTLAINSKTIRVAVADTDLKRTQGLSDRKQLSDDQGMLFVFEQPGMHSFWMKDMKFDIDIIWIKKNNLPDGLKHTIVGITANVPAPVKNKGLGFNDYALPLYSPPEPVDMVLETRAGWSKKYNIEIGDEVKLKTRSGGASSDISSAI